MSNLTVDNLPSKEHDDRKVVLEQSRKSSCFELWEGTRKWTVSKPLYSDRQEQTRRSPRNRVSPLPKKFILTSALGLPPISVISKSLFPTSWAYWWFNIKFQPPETVLSLFLDQQPPCLSGTTWAPAILCLPRTKLQSHCSVTMKLISGIVLPHHCSHPFRYLSSHLGAWGVNERKRPPLMRITVDVWDQTPPKAKERFITDMSTQSKRVYF